jgi:GWxTD domain-containing protein
MWYSRRTCVPAGIAVLAVLVGAWSSLGITDDRYDEGVRAYQDQRYVEARNHLRAVFQDSPAYVGQEGAVAYWLGRAYAACEQPDSSRWAWREGMKALRAADAFDARLFDAHLWASVEVGALQRASRTYLGLLRRLGSVTGAPEVDVLRRHVAQLRLVLPDLLLRQLLANGNENNTPEKWNFMAGAGSQVVAWWQRQDPLPATDQNERVAEHLHRINTARANFSASDQVDWLDDRGETYVRFGAPARRTEVPFTDLSFLQEVFRSGVPLDRSAFPDNEIWSYPHINEAGRYLFVSKDGTYTLGTATDLLPDLLLGPFSSSDRSQNIAYSSQVAIRYIYEHLSMKYNDRRGVYNSVMDWFNFQESRRSLSSMREDMGRETNVRTIGYGSGARRIYQSPSNSWPSSAARNSVRSIQVQERQFAHRRDKEMPREYASSDRPNFDPEVQYRVARFLDENGATRTEVYWGERFASDTMETRRLTVSAFRYDERYRQKAEQTATHVLSPEVHSRTEKTHRITLPGKEDLAGQDSYHVAVQWDLYPDSGGVSREKETGLVKSQVARIDSLRALRAVSSQLEMSDLRLMSVPPAARKKKISPLQEAVPYPYDTATTETPLFLYFELYHLGQTNQGQTRYTVTYEARRRTRKGFFGRLFGSDTRTEVTSATAEYSGQKRRTEEYLQLGLEADPERPQSTRITVQVTDNVTGNAIERTLSLTLTPSEAVP